MSEIMYAGEVTKAPTELSDDFRALYPVELDVLRDLATVSFEEQNSSYDRAIRVYRTLRDFTTGRIHPYAYSAALMADVLSRFDDDLTVGNAKRALRRYADNVEAEQWEFVSCIISDNKVLDTVANNKRLTNEQDPEVNQVLTTNGDGSVPTLMWNTRLGLTDAILIKDTLAEINVESFLYKSAAMLDKLVTHTGTERELLHDLIDTESFYEPICRILGYDALGMALRNVTETIRAKKLGNIAALDRAQQDLDSIGNRETVVKNLGQMFGEIFDGIGISEFSISNESQHNIALGTSDFLEPVPGVTELTAKWRVKTLGRLAASYAANPNKEMDLLGVTLVVKDLGQLALVFSGLYNKVSNHEDFRLTPSRSRTAAVHVKGRSTFLKKVMQHKAFPAKLRDRTFNDIVSLGKDDKGYQIAKITTMYNTGNDGGNDQWIPVEIQVQTEADREKARVGVTAHIARNDPQLKKLMEIYPEILKEIRDRREMVGKHIAIEPSRIRGKNLRELIAAKHIKPLQYPQDRR